MKYALTILIVFGLLLANAQSTTTYRRITATTSTIPASDTIIGRVWTDSSNTTYKKLTYVGGVDLDSMWHGSDIGKNGFTWIYLPSNATPFARVMSIAEIGVDSFSITTDRALTGVVNQSLKGINGKIYAYWFQNDGDTNGTANGVIIKPSEKVEFPYSWIQGTGTNWQEPVKIAATLTDFLVIEKR